MFLSLCLIFISETNNDRPSLTQQRKMHAVIEIIMSEHSNFKIPQCLKAASSFAYNVCKDLEI